jgi:N-acetylmuramoyl-L-alanine amidase
VRRTLRLRAAQTGFPLRLSLVLALLVSLAPGAWAQSDSGSRRATAKAQFERAEKDRSALEGRPAQDRSLDDYQRVVNTYRRVYHITPHAAEVPAALVAVAELYQQMGRQFDEKHFQSAIDVYQFLLHEYPATRYREDALLTIGNIQKDDLDKPEQAQKTFEEFLRLHPGSSRAQDAREALEEISSDKVHDKEQARKPAPVEKAPQTAETREARSKLPQVTRIRILNSSDYTRVEINLDGAVQYHAARIKDPDRVYFDLYDAKLNSTLADKTIDVEGGFLKAVRVAQNQAGIVRVVLDLDRVKNYSAYLLLNPHRLVVDVYGEPVVAQAPAKPRPDAGSQPAEKTAELKPAPNATQAVKKTDVAQDLPPGPYPDKTQVARSEPSPPPRLESPAPMETPKTVPASIGKQPAPPLRASGRKTAIGPPPAPQPTKNGEHSLTRALGLKIGRIVIDAGHGGHDTGTVGPTGLMEKDLCLDVALRLGKLIHQRLPGAEVVYTREDDTYIPLEDRTAIANEARADLFLSIHANSSPDHRARGIETYYLNLASSQDALEVAARENALAQGSVHDLQDMLKKIARNEKLEESREFATDIQDSLLKRLQRQNRSLKDRGVRKAPFVVLIGANMPSVLAEVSFISNPADEQLLKKPDGRQRVAEGLYHGVESYLQSLNSISLNQSPSSSKPAAGSR